MKIEKNKDKRCPIGMNSSQKKSIDNILVNVVHVTEDKPSINTQVHNQNDTRDNLHSSDKA